MLPVFTLFLAAYLPGRIKGALKHPMLISVMLWALAHLIATGMLANVVLFGGFLRGQLQTAFRSVAYAAADSHGAVYEVESASPCGRPWVTCFRTLACTSDGSESNHCDVAPHARGNWWHLFFSRRAR